MTGTSADESVPEPVDTGGGTERWKQRGVTLRVFVYVILGHVLAGWLWFLFYLGRHSH